MKINSRFGHFLICKNMRARPLRYTHVPISSFQIIPLKQVNEITLKKHFADKNLQNILAFSNFHKELAFPRIRSLYV